jgi:hypothetical protein
MPVGSAEIMTQNPVTTISTPTVVLLQDLWANDGSAWVKRWRTKNAQKDTTNDKLFLLPWYGF